MFNNLTSEGLEESTDYLGGYQTKESDIYTGIIKAAYGGKSKHGALSVSLLIDFNGTEYRETIYVTNRKGENWFTSKQKKKVPLPGFTIINDLCVIATSSELADQPTEQKVIKLWDYESKAEVPTKVDMLVDLIEQEVSFGIIKQIEDKNVQNSAGDYVPSGETREVNVIDKVFHTETKMTLPEGMAGATEPAFWEAWLKKNQGQTKNRSKGVAAGQAGKPVQQGSAAPKSLFPKK